MNIAIVSIPPEGRRFPLSAGEPWIANVIREALPHENPSLRSVAGHLTLSCVEETVTISGIFQVELNPVCARCAEEYPFPLKVPIQMHLIPSLRSSSPAEDDADLSFGSHDGVEINLGDLLREAIVLALPLRILCSPNCKGLCPHCGTNLNASICTCSPRS